MNPVEKYLRQTAEAMAELGKQVGVKVKGDFANMHEFVLAHGREFEFKPLPKGVKLGKKGLCFKNAFDLATSKPSKYAYVEGWAAGIIPVEHAWCVTENGIVVDPTWEEDIGHAGLALGKFAHSYFGVAFSNTFVIRTAVSRGVYGVMDNYEEQWPLLRGEFPEGEWKHEWFTEAARCSREDP